jgi:hypothetical protein
MREKYLRGRGMNPWLLGLALILACLLFEGTLAHADVEDVLLERGTITKEDWLKIKADKEKEQSKQAGKGLEHRAETPIHQSLEQLKGLDISLVAYFNFTAAMGDSFTADQQRKGLNGATAADNRGLAQGFHVTRTYLNVRKDFEGGHRVRLTLDQMVNDVGGNNCPNGAGSTAGNCHEAAPFGLSGFAGTGRNSTFVKYAYYNHIIVPGLELRAGMEQTPWIEYEESRWTYRYLFPTMVDQQNLQTSSDLGVSLLGKVLDNRVEYHVSFQEGEGYQNTPDGRGFAALGRVSVEPSQGVILSLFGHNERLRNGIEGFNPQRALMNIEVYDPTADRFKLNFQAVWADDGSDIGQKGFFPGGRALNVPSTYTGNTSTAAATYGGVNGPSTSIPRFHQARGWETWAWWRLPGLEKVRLHGRYYFMKPNKDTEAGNIQSYYAGISYDYSKWLAFSLNYEVYNQTVLGNTTGALAGLNIATGPNCATCGQYVRYDNQIIGLRMLVAF